MPPPPHIDISQYLKHTGGRCSLLHRYHRALSHPEDLCTDEHNLSHGRSKMSDMGDSERTGRSPASQVNWLPLTRKSIFMPKPLTVAIIQSRKPNDWFFNLASSLITPTEPAQGKMLAKLYCFMLDYLPRGLTGQYGHINGNDLMTHLLCASGETAPSRHKLIKDAKAAWDELEQWMRKGQDWRQALQRARSEHGKQEPSRRRASWKAPGLFSPAGVLALVAMVPQHTARIDSLDISWMVRPHETLDVQEGFWAGLNAANLHMCFSPAEQRHSDIEFRADYNLLFGEHFPRCRKNMRPFLPQWARHLTIQHSPVDVDLTASPPADGTSLEPSHAEVSDPGIDCQRFTALRLALDPKAETTSALENWLHAQLVKGTQVIQLWCQRWAERVLTCEDHEEQAVIQSLFLQSLRRLVNFYDGDSDGSDKPGALPGAEAYMLLDIEDAGLWSQEPDIGDTTAACHRLPRMTAFVACKKAMDVLVQQTKSSPWANGRLTSLAADQAIFYGSTLINPDLAPHVRSTMSLEELRTQFISQRLRQSDRGTGIRDLGDLEFEDRLQLTAWQVQLMCIPGEPMEKVLTDVQLRIFQSPDSVDHSEHAPITPQATTSSHQAPGDDEQSPRYLLSLLLGDSPLPGAPPSPRTRSQSQHTISTEPHDAAGVHGKDDAAFAENTPVSGGTEEDLFIGPAPAQACTPPDTARDEEEDLFSGTATSRGCKRGMQGQGGKVPKQARLCDMTRDDWTTELQTDREKWRQDMGEMFRAESHRLDEVKADVITKLNVDRQQLTEDLKAFSTERMDAGSKDVVAAIGAVDKRLSDEFRLAAGGRQDDIERLVQASERLLKECTTNTERTGRELLTRVDAALETVLAQSIKTHEEIRGIHTRLSELQEQQGMLQQTVGAELGAFRAAFDKAPLPGETGYLAQHCPAPLEWEQKAYESYTFRAALSYISFLDSRSKEIQPDQEAWMATKTDFPGVPQRHMMAALNHAHVQMYNRPFNRKTST